MKKVIIKQMKLVNFKGLRDFTIEFNDSVTSVHGKNGSGKTTIFDAFTWLLFGKDSEDRKAFNIKTLDANGVAIPRLPHEVSATLMVDGETVNLCRRFNEKWVRRRGSAIEEFTGHEEERLYNEVPMSVKEWGDKIAAICSEQVFKFITNPLYFCAQKSDVQRAMLFRMAGTISDEDIAAGNADFMALLANLTGKTMEEYKREIAAKKRRIKAEIDSLPERIDERKRDMPETEDWAALEAEMEAKKNEISRVEKSILDRSEAYKTACEERENIQKQIFDLRQKKMEREHEIINVVEGAYLAKMREQKELYEKRFILNNEIASWQKERGRRQVILLQLRGKRENLIAEWKEIKSHELKFDSDVFICPTCKRPLDTEDIEKKQAEMTASFNAKKASKLEDNVRRGQEVKRAIEDEEAAINELDERINDAQVKVQMIGTEPDMQLTRPDATPMIAADETITHLNIEIAKLEASITVPVKAADAEELSQQNNVLRGELDNIKMRLAKREIIERNDARINELESQLREQSEELAQLEGIELTMAAFSKAKIEAVERRINGLFSVVRFKMFETQINGGEVETCEATVNGVPYSDVNAAMKINAGLDIINAICQFEQVSAPIFCDNAESINEILPTQSQMIRLVVTTDESLKIQ